MIITFDANRLVVSNVNVSTQTSVKPRAKQITGQSNAKPIVNESLYTHMIEPF